MKFPAPHKMSILIVDSHDDMRRSMRSMLKQAQLGKYFFEASNGQDGWEFLERCREPLHLIISDLNMPRISGTKLLAKVRGSAKYRETPFLIVASEANRSTVANAAENEVDAYLAKPFALEAFEKKIRDLLEKASNPSPWTKHLKRARSFEEKGNLKAAIREIGEAIKTGPRASKPIRELGRIYLNMEKYQEGLQCFEKATAMNDLDVSAFHYMGQTYFQLNMLDEAMSSYSKAMDINPRHTDRAVKFATVLLKGDKREEAEKILKQAVQTGGEDLDLSEDIIELCLENGLNELAAKACQMVMEKDPDRKYLSGKRGTALLRSGQAKEASHVLQQSMDSFSDDLELMLTLARSYLDSNEKDKANEVAHMVLQLDPENKEAKEILEQCP